MAIIINKTDNITDDITVINHNHHEIHEGNFFTVTDRVEADTTTIQWQITTPAGTTYAHMFFSLACTGEALYVLTEGSDMTDGTALNEVNRRRAGTPGVASVVVTRTPTGGSTVGETTLFTEHYGSTGVASKTVEGGSTRGENEWILKPGTKYVVSITSYVDNVYVTCKLDWYELSEA